MTKHRILLVSNIIPHYRIAFYNELGKKFDLTIIHSGNVTVYKNCSYKEIIALKYKFGPFYFQKRVIGEVCSRNYEVVIAMCDLRWINNLIAIFIKPNRVKYIFWGSWFSNKRIVNVIKLALAMKADANLYYCKEHMMDFVGYSSRLDSTKLFVANNTIDIGVRVKSYESSRKTSILFVGTLDKRKQLHGVITAFKNIINDISVEIELNIIGSGEEYENLRDYILFLKLQDRVKLRGRINDSSILRNYYSDAIVSVSFGQAGLSVLQSLGFGVPIITKKNAISGGEIFNIKHGYNGFICQDNLTSLGSFLKILCQNVELSRRMGENAFSFYTENCRVENMVSSFEDAISYAINN